MTAAVYASRIYTFFVYFQFYLNFITLVQALWYAQALVYSNLTTFKFWTAEWSLKNESSCAPKY